MDFIIMNTAEYLTQLIDCKEDMKAALIEKGAPPTGGLSTYADAISEIYQKPLPTSITSIKFGSCTVSSIDLFKIGLNTENYTDMSYMFNGCNNLTGVSNLITDNVTDMSGMFANCNIITARELNTINVTDMSGMFYNCQSLRYVPLYEAGNVENVEGMFEMSALHNDLIIMGFKDLGQKENLESTKYLFYARYNGSVNARNNLTRESKINIINNLYDRASAGYSILPIDFLVDDLTEDEIAVLTNKGWRIEHA